MTPAAHLWAIGYDDVDGAGEVRDQAIKLGDSHVLALLDVAVVVRYGDGTTTLNGESLMAPARALRGSMTSLLAGIALATPILSGGAVNRYLEEVDAATAPGVGIPDNFIRDVERLLRPGSSALFVLDRAGNLETVLSAIRGWGGTVLKTSVDLAEAELIQQTLSAAAN